MYQITDVFITSAPRDFKVHSSLDGSEGSIKTRIMYTLNYGLWLSVKFRRYKPRVGSYLIPFDQRCLFSLVSTRTSGVPIIFSANLRISLMARGALFLKPLCRWESRSTLTWRWGTNAYPWWRKHNECMSTLLAGWTVGEAPGGSDRVVPAVVPDYMVQAACSGTKH